jgi:hypothetical protein
VVDVFSPVNAFISGSFASVLFADILLKVDSQAEAFFGFYRFFSYA